MAHASFTRALLARYALCVLSLMHEVKSSDAFLSCSTAGNDYSAIRDYFCQSERAPYGQNSSRCPLAALWDGSFIPHIQVTCSKMHWTEARGSYVVFVCGKSQIGQRFCWGCELDWGEERLTRGFIVFSGEWKAVGPLRTNCWSNVGKRALTEEAVLSGDIFCWGGRDEVRGWKRGLAKLTQHQCWNNETRLV